MGTGIDGGSAPSYGVVQTHSCQELYAVRNLTNQGYEAFCPLENRPSRSDPSRMVETPLFPSYAFVLLAPDQPWWSINSTYGVVRLLTRGRDRSGPPMLVPDLGERVSYALEKLRKSVEEPFRPGTIVRITRGPFESYRGRVECLDKRMRLGVLLSIFDRETRVWFGDPTALEEELA